MGDLCPRCGGGFVCGIDGAGPCLCTTVRLDEAVLAELRGRYAGCLCMRCLSSLSRERERVGVRAVPSTGDDAVVRDASPSPRPSPASGRGSKSVSGR